MFKVLRVYRDEYGTTRQRYVGNRAYKTLKAASMKADASRGGYVIPLGCNDPVYVGVWQ